MGKLRLKLRDLTRILNSYGVEASAGRAKGSHILFTKSGLSYPIPNREDVLPCYVKGVRAKFRLLPEDGVSDEEFRGH